MLVKERSDMFVDKSVNYDNENFDNCGFDVKNSKAPDYA